MSNSFDKVRQAYHERNSIHAEIGYEESRVRYLLKTLRFSPAAIRTLAAEEQLQTNFARMTFRFFNETYPSFPLLLGVSTLGGVKLHLDKRAMLPSLFVRFGEAPFVEAYDDFKLQVRERAAGRGIGLIFPRKGIRQGLLVHDDSFELSIPRSLTLVYTGERDRRVYVRSFQQVAEAIYGRGHGWKPE